VDLGSSDPQMLGPECSFQAADVPKLFIRAAATIAGASQASARIYWERSNGAAAMSTAQSQGFTLTADGQFRTYEITLSGTSTWTGQISRLRLDPVSSGKAGDFVDIQFISAFSPSTIFIDVASGTQTQAATGNAVLTGTAGLTKSGAGTLTLNTSNAYTGTTRVAEGRLVLGHGSAVASSTVTVAEGGAVVVGSAIQARAKGLFLEARAAVDVASGRLTVTGGLSPTTLVAALVEGRAGGTWSGTTGIMSSIVASDIKAGRARAVGWIENGSGSLTFGYAAPGDTNLDGIVDTLDAAGILAAGRYGSGTGARWSDGDFNYDGLVDVRDAAELLTSGLFNAGFYGGSSAAVVPVPEPRLLACLGLSIVMAALRRRGCPHTPGRG
jgi:autotransporter-associated beta strand protein